jgi:hypothetical protein
MRFGNGYSLVESNVNNLEYLSKMNLFALKSVVFCSFNLIFLFLQPIWDISLNYFLELWCGSSVGRAMD